MVRFVDHPQSFERRSSQLEQREKKSISDGVLLRIHI